MKSPRHSSAQGLRGFLLFYNLFLTFALCAQVVYVEPAFPRVDDNITVFFDATQGTGGLANCACDVYLHSGVITSKSTSGSDWKYVKTTWGVANNAWKLTPVSGKPNLYQITYNIRAFYGVPESETVLRLAFVFRNANGSKEGKDTGGSDIFYDVYPETFPYTVRFQAPGSSSQVLTLGRTIAVRGVASASGSLQLFDNNQLITSTSGALLEHNIVVETAGDHKVQLIGEQNGSRDTATFFYTGFENAVVADPPTGTPAGASFPDAATLRLALTAPGKQYVNVIGDFNDWRPLAGSQMKKSSNGEIFWLDIPNIQAGQTLRYQYLVDGNILIADPLSTLVLDPANDPFISPATYPDMPPYPNGKTTGLVSAVRVGGTPYNWQYDETPRPKKEELTIYELLVRDFVEKHDYKTLIDSLRYLKQLGVNAIELMPVSEFEGNLSWGYNVSFHMALDKYYGPMSDFKRFVDICHGEGMAVILDVVYNHAFGQSPLVQLYFDGQKPRLDNPWLNPEAKHPFNVGYDFNHESKFTRSYVKQTLDYWLRECHVDGFRFDLSKGFTQTFNTDVGRWGQYDAGRIGILKDYADAVWAVNPDAYVILEHFGENREETELTNYGMLVWGNMNHAYNEASMGFNSDLSGATYKSRGWTQPALVSYMESHDEERMMYKNLQFGNNGPNGYNVKSLTTALARQELASALYYTIPGPKMLWQFGELGYDVNIDFNGRTGNKPIRWNYFQEPDRRKLYEVVSALLYLRNTYPVFHTTDFSHTLSSALQKTIQLNSSDLNITVLGNFGVASSTINPRFQHPGTWYEYFSGDSIVVTNITAALPIQAGEYRLYADKKLSRPETVTLTGVSSPVWTNGTVNLFPNPANDRSTLSLELQRPARIQLEWWTTDGKLLQRLPAQQWQAGAHQLELTLPAVPGLYFLRLQDGVGVKVLPVVRW